MVNEIRRDYLVDRWVIFAPKRAKRPNDFAFKRSKPGQRTCAFCPGNENLTPPAELLYVRQRNMILKSKDAARRRRSDWTVRCVPNMFPVLGRSRDVGNSQVRSQFVKRPAIGFHEVIVESPTHDGHPDRISGEQVTLWLNAAKERMQEMTKQKGVSSIVLFRNHGGEAGASIAHAHSQIIATPIIPTRIREEHLAMKQIRNRAGTCAMCHIRRVEEKGRRRIANLPGFTVFAPWASVFPFEFWVVPKRHSASMLELSQNEMKCLGNALHNSFKALTRSLSDPPYNAVFHMAPSKFLDDVYHWHIEVYPKMTTLAGFELGSGMYINVMKPEAAAAVLAENI